jgi:hypothetical protein
MPAESDPGTRNSRISRDVCRSTAVTRFHAAGLALLCLIASPVRADSYVPIRELPQFWQLVDGRELRIGLYNLTLNLSPDGQISGTAMGWEVTGSWRWEDGYFCRKMDWSGHDIPYNCQLVELRGNDKLRFTADQGAGDSATFRLR